MRKTTLVIAALLLLALAGITACSSGNQPPPEEQLSSVTSGDLEVTVTGDGKTELVRDAELTFGTAGRIKELLVEEGDEVSQGQTIARLDTNALELALAQAEFAYAQAQLTLKQYELAESQAGITVTQAEINQKNAQMALEQTTKSSSVSDIRIAQADVETAQRNVKDALSTLSQYLPGTPGYEEYQKTVNLAQARLKNAKDRLDAMLGGFSTDEVIVKEQMLTAANQAVAAAKQSLEQAKLTAETGKQALELAGKARDYARRQLDEATITAPFAGIIARVPVAEKDTVLPTTLVAHLVDPSGMELRIQIDEIDIPGVKNGQRAIVKVDALPGADLSGRVSYISQLPTKEGGVTMFEVRIALEAIGVGLKGGMSASADIVTVERKNVLLVPSQAIKHDSHGGTVVKVVNRKKLVDQSVEIGAANDSSTEIVSGLIAGTKVVVQ